MGVRRGSSFAVMVWGKEASRMLIRCVVRAVGSEGGNRGSRMVASSICWGEGLRFRRALMRRVVGGWRGGEGRWVFRSRVVRGWSAPLR